MKIKSEQLKRALDSNELPCYWLAGDEPLLMQEAADLIRAHYRDRGFTEREVFNVERGFNWETFAQATGNLSLFAERKIIELRFSSARLDDAGKQAIQRYLDQANPDFLLLISSPRLEAGTLNTKWFKSIESGGALVQLWPINRDGLAQWLNQRLQREGIHADGEALQLLSDKVEGNLLAAMQEIEKLRLLANAGKGESIRLDINTVMQVVADSSRHNAFQLVDAALAGDGVRAQRILHGLRAEGVFPLLVLNALSKELRSLLAMLEKKEQGQGVNAVMQAAHVWFNRKAAVGAALNRLHSEDIWYLLEQARLTDQAVKGMSRANPWDELSLMLLALSGRRTATMPGGLEPAAS